MAKLLRKRKQFGRCRVEGHGDNWKCEPTAELQSQPFTRSQDKKEWKDDVEEELEAAKTMKEYDYIDDILNN